MSIDLVAYDFGARAFMDGLDDSANPYTPDTLAFESWLQGWDHAYMATQDVVPQG